MGTQFYGEGLIVEEIAIGFWVRHEAIQAQV